MANFENGLDNELKKTIIDANQGFSLGLKPRLTMNGTSGSYFLKNCYRKNIVLFFFLL